MNTQSHRPYIAVAMSGGVDSSVTAALLLEQGYQVIGVTMWLPKLTEFQHAAFSESDALPDAIHDARLVANLLGIRHEVIDLRQAFQQQVIRYFCDEYAAGRTPNPCVICNPQIKFGLLFERASAFGAEAFATGHYAQICYDETRRRYLLKAAAHTAKDQSYFLYRLSQVQLARTLFPLANLTKDVIRAKAKTLGFERIERKAESQENCFLAADQTYQQFLARTLPPEQRKPGRIVDMNGRVLGEHQGIPFYTIGQRKGLGIASGTPLYIVAIQPETNTIILGEQHNLFAQTCRVRSLNFIAIEHLTSAMNAQVKIRYRNAATPARITPGDAPDEVIVTFETPQRAITPGQSAVFYQNALVIGGGIIVKSEE